MKQKKLDRILKDVGLLIACGFIQFGQWVIDRMAGVISGFADGF
ncbi:hypothetical protein [Weissella cibaria]|nr:hypothetical protein [Weissella cibaria]